MIGEDIINNNENNKPKAEYRILMIILTILTLGLSIYGKIYTIGLITIALFIMLIIPIHFVLFTISGILLANIKNKTKIDYICFFALCSTILLYAYTFVDGSPTGTKYNIFFPSVDENILSNISFTSFIVNIVLSIVSIVRFVKKLKKNKNNI